MTLHKPTKFQREAHKNFVPPKCPVTNKVSYHSRSMAKKHLRRIRNKCNNGNYKPGEGDVYVCQFCKYYHVGKYRDASCGKRPKL